MTTDTTIACDEPLYLTETVHDMLRDAITSCRFEDSEIRPSLLKTIRADRDRLKRGKVHALTGPQAAQWAKRMLTGFGSPVYRLPDDERLELTAYVIERGAAMEAGSVIVTARPAEIPEGAWMQSCGSPRCGKQYIAHHKSSRYCSKTCTKYAERSRKRGQGVAAQPEAS